MDTTLTLLRRGIALWTRLVAGLDALQPLAALAARLYIAQVFFLSGLTKIRDWESTLFLFHEEYKVPLLSPALAAVMGTTGELALPALLVLGLGGRFAALGLSVVNVMAALSLPDIARRFSNMSSGARCWQAWPSSARATGRSSAGCGHG